jgi:CBS domain-containing protein
VYICCRCALTLCIQNRNNKIGGLPVVEHGSKRVIGIVTESDFLDQLMNVL